MPRFTRQRHHARLAAKARAPLNPANLTRKLIRIKRDIMAISEDIDRALENLAPSKPDASQKDLPL